MEYAYLIALIIWVVLTVALIATNSAFMANTNSIVVNALTNHNLIGLSLAEIFDGKVNDGMAMRTWGRVPRIEMGTTTVAHHDECTSSIPLITKGCGNCAKLNTEACPYAGGGSYTAVLCGCSGYVYTTAPVESLSLEQVLILSDNAYETHEYQFWCSVYEAKYERAHIVHHVEGPYYCPLCEGPSNDGSLCDSCMCEFNEAKLVEGPYYCPLCDGPSDVMHGLCDTCMTANGIWDAFNPVCTECGTEVGDEDALCDMCYEARQLSAEARAFADWADADDLHMETYEDRPSIGAPFYVQEADVEDTFCRRPDHKGYHAPSDLLLGKCCSSEDYLETWFEETNASSRSFRQDTKSWKDHRTTQYRGTQYRGSRRA